MARFFRCLVAGAASAALVVTPAQAQFGGIFGGGSRDTEDEQTSDGCAEGKKQSTGSRVLGGILGAVAQNAASRAGVSSWVPVGEFTTLLSSAIACQLDPDEQKQAADATLEATRGVGEGTEDPAPAEIGSTASWTSETREDVSGTSTVTSRLASDDGADCIVVTDVVIVKGEETKADKKMCRPPGSRRYSIIV